MIKLWFGSKSVTNLHRSYQKAFLANNRRLKKDGYLYWPRYSNPSNNSMIPLPPHWKLILLRKTLSSKNSTLIYVYNESYFFTFQLPIFITFFEVVKGSKVLFLSQQFYSPFYTHYLNCLLNLLRTFSSVKFVKMKFKGKGYYVYKNYRHTIAPQFGYYHRIYVYAFNVSVKFLSKTSVLLFGLSKRDLVTVGFDFQSKKNINIFTGRGVRFSRQVIYRKTGKVSAYR